MQWLKFKKHELFLRQTRLQILRYIDKGEEWKKFQSKMIFIFHNLRPRKMCQIGLNTEANCNLHVAQNQNWSHGIQVLLNLRRFNYLIIGFLSPLLHKNTLNLKRYISPIRLSCPIEIVMLLNFPIIAGQIFFNVARVTRLADRK